MISIPFVKIGYLEKSEKESILSANSASRTAGRNRYRFWVNLNPKFILTIYVTIQWLLQKLDIE